MDDPISVFLNRRIRLRATVLPDAGTGRARWHVYNDDGENSLESAGDGGLMVIGLSGSLGDGDGSRLVIMVPFVKCCIGCITAGGGGERRPLTPGINGPPPP